MRLKMVRRLVDVNIIYATQPAQLAKFRKKQEKDPTRKVNVSAQSIRTYIFIGLLYLFLLGYFLVPMILSLALVPLSI